MRDLRSLPAGNILGAYDATFLSVLYFSLLLSFSVYAPLCFSTFVMPIYQFIHRFTHFHESLISHLIYSIY